MVHECEKSNMTMILVYKCSKNCGLRAPLHRGFPEFSQDTPQNLLKVPVKSINSAYVTGYTNEEVCLACRKIVIMSDPEAFTFLQYRRAKEDWESKNLLEKLRRYVTRVKKPQLSECTHLGQTCPECGAEDRFLTEGMVCHLCGVGEVIVDDRATAYF